LSGRARRSLARRERAKPARVPIAFPVQAAASQLRRSIRYAPGGLETGAARGPHSWRYRYRSAGRARSQAPRARPLRDCRRRAAASHATARHEESGAPSEGPSSVRALVARHRCRCDNRDSCSLAMPRWSGGSAIRSTALGVPACWLAAPSTTGAARALQQRCVWTASCEAKVHHSTVIPRLSRCTSPDPLEHRSPNIIERQDRVARTSGATGA